MKYIILSFITCLLPLLSSYCQNRNPNLSNKRILELQDSISKATKTVQFDTSYVPPAGARYQEIRSVKSSVPPVLIDIAGNLGNKKTFKLSDIATGVRYIILRQPPDLKYKRIIEVVSDNEHIFIKTGDGLFCYSPEGQYLFTAYLNKLEENSPASKMSIGGITITKDPFISGIVGNIDLLNGKLVFRTSEEASGRWLNVYDVKELESKTSLNSKPNELKKNYPEPIVRRKIKGGGNDGRATYLWLDNESLFTSYTLTNILTKGDTLCKFKDYDLPTINPEAQRLFVNSDSYRINGHIMLQKNHNDTVFMVAPPNLLIPAYVMKWGDYKPNLNQHIAGAALEGKFVLSKWIETPGFIFIYYTDGRNYPIHRKEKKVKDYWAIYNKSTKTLSHHIPSIMFEKSYSAYTMFENNIEPIGMPFYPSGINHNGEMYMTFSKEDIKEYISTGKFPKDKLQAIYDNIPDGSFCLMLVK